MKLKPLALGIALGSVWGASVCITTWISCYTGYGHVFLETMALSIYPGYTITPVGSVLGLVYGFIDGLVGGAVLAWVYNRIVKAG